MVSHRWPTSSILGDLTGNGPQIIGNHAPADPAMHAILAVIQAAVQAEAAFQQANAGLKTSPPIAARAKPRLDFMSLAGWGTRTRPGDSHMVDALVNSISL